MVVQWPSPETLWRAVLVGVMVSEVVALSGPNVCLVQQKYNITKRVKYRAPMSVRTYEWCFAMPPRCSRWTTEMRDLTRLETEERTAEVAVCCPGYKMKDVSCVPICPSGKMGHGCNEDCPPDKWGPNCVNECPECLNGFCVPSTGECDCEEGWQGESCQISMSTVQAAPALMEELLTTTKSTIKTLPTTKSTIPTARITELSTLISTPRVTVTDMLITSTPSTTTMVLTSPKVTFASTNKTENTISHLMTSTQPTKSTSFFIYDNVTTRPFTNEFVNTKTTEKLPKVTVTNFIYNRTETPEEGTSNLTINFSNEHETSSMPGPISIKFSLAPLTSPSTTSTYTTTTTSPSTTSTTTSTSTTPTSRTIVKTPSATISKATTTIMEDSTKIETTKRAETSTKNHLTTLKFKPKEIWIKPSQKGVPIFTETKVKNHETHAKFKSATHKNEATSENTTPKTIIVSIIPTSVSHATFKKIALTTASYLSYKSNSSTKYNKTEQSFTKSMTSQVSTVKPFTIKLLSTVSVRNSSSKVSTRFSKNNVTLKVTPSAKKVFLNTTTSTSEKHSTTMATLNLSMSTLNSNLPTSNTTMATSTTNSMSSTLNANKKLNSSTVLTTKPPTNKYVHKSLNELTTESAVSKKPYVNDDTMSTGDKKLTTYINGPIKVEANHTSTVKQFNNSKGPVKVEVTKTKEIVKYTSPNNTKKVNTKWNVTKTSTNSPVTTQEPTEDETFHILTEPEHITAVMNDKEREHTSMDLISVISIAGGVMMAIITVAVIIVMIERCKRPRYEDIRKVNDIRMQVMIDNKDPPPYVRSIFHTPLPDPPSDNCHYQPISTLDRNLKQFMRPVVVEAISPIMLENFRGILECHYDHLPNRNHRINHEFGTMPTRCSVSPSMKCDDELLRQRPLSVADYTIEALKCEAKMDILDNNTVSEPLYAEIPCWRPPSEYAIEVMNLNGEAVTEL